MLIWEKEESSMIRTCTAMLGSIYSWDYGDGGEVLQYWAVTF